MSYVEGKYFPDTLEGNKAAEAWRLYLLRMNRGEPEPVKPGVDYGNDPATMGMTWPELLRYRENTQNLANLPPLGFAGMTVGWLAKNFGLPAVNRAIAERQRVTGIGQGYAEGAGRDIFTNPNAAEVLGRIPLPANVPANIYEGGAGYSGQQIEDLELARGLPPVPENDLSFPDFPGSDFGSNQAARGLPPAPENDLSFPDFPGSDFGSGQLDENNAFSFPDFPGSDFRDGGMLGFRPLGYADGDLVEKYVYPDKESRQDAINFIMETTGSTSDSMAMTLLELSDSELRRAYLKVAAEAEVGQLPQQIPQIAAAYSDTAKERFAELVPPLVATGMGRRFAQERQLDGAPADISNLIPSPLVATGMGRRFAQERQLDEEGPGNFPMNYPSPLQRNRGGIASLRRY